MLSPAGLNATATIAALLLSITTQPVKSNSWEVRAWQRPFDYASEARHITYTPLAQAQHDWQLCAVYPHLKDSYWLSVNYGMVSMARSLGVGLQIYEAGGYPNLERQRSQLQDCADSDADAIILGSVSYGDLSDTVVEIAREMPVIATVNDIANAGITAKVGVPWTEMGRAPAQYLAEHHPLDTEAVNVAWFPGQGGWTHFVEQGFHETLEASSARIVTTQWGDTGMETQHLLLEEVLDNHPDIDYAVGSAVMAETATGLLRARDRQGDIGLLATYFTHGVYRGIKRGKILAAPNDYPALQGRLSVDMAVRVLQDEMISRHVGPVVDTVDTGSVNMIDLDQSLSPATFTPVFAVNIDVAD
ncbi:MAG: TMAO reductase system periplasmic protein TorT [Spiribacter salinus]|uniref:TMAO reductase system periplasmic protein TorT n=1 Tax=Spiribacter salinus TaxID=1335746 RepID=A0A540VR60_9GAMM|nr:MAG: TMAO reductase system periplasmic protein TorT [Spiribacter salinus]